MNLNDHGAVYEYLLALCPPLPSAPPWDFLSAAPDCRGPVADPAATLAALQAKFCNVQLELANVAKEDPDGYLRLRPALFAPSGAVIAFRSRPGHQPFDLLTRRSCLIKRPTPIEYALLDSWTVERVLATRVLFGVFDIRELILLRQLDLPATLCRGLLRSSAEELRDLDARFETWEFSPASGRDYGPFPSEEWVHEDDSAPVAYHPIAKIKPTLVLMGWSLLALTTVPNSPLVYRAAKHLAAARHYLGLNFAGVSVWRPTPAEVENLQFRLTLPKRDKKLVRELLLESVDGLYDIEQFADPEGLSPEEPPATVAEARAELLSRLADRGPGPLPQRVRAAMAKYRELVERDLVRPLQDWAMGNDHPVVQSAGNELAAVSAMLHEMGPSVHELVRQCSEMSLSGDAEPRLSQTLAQYLQLVNRHGALMRDLRCWSKWI